MGIFGRKTPDTGGYGDWQTDWVGVVEEFYPVKGSTRVAVLHRLLPRAAVRSRRPPPCDAVLHRLLPRAAVHLHRLLPCAACAAACRVPLAETCRVPLAEACWVPLGEACRVPLGETTGVEVVLIWGWIEYYQSIQQHWTTAVATLGTMSTVCSSNHKFWMYRVYGHDLCTVGLKSMFPRLVHPQ